MTSLLGREVVGSRFLEALLIEIVDKFRGVL